MFQLSTQKYGYLPKFPRIQLIHELLWQLVYGQTAQKTSDVIDENESKASAEQELSGDRDDQVNTNLDDEWMKHLKPMPKLYDDARQPLHGWFRLTDVLLVMPLEILCKTIDITEEVKRRITHTVCFFELKQNFTNIIVHVPVHCCIF